MMPLHYNYQGEKQKGKLYIFFKSQVIEKGKDPGRMIVYSCHGALVNFKNIVLYF